MTALDFFYSCNSEYRSSQLIFLLLKHLRALIDNDTTLYYKFPRFKY